MNGLEERRFTIKTMKLLLHMRPIWLNLFRIQTVYTIVTMFTKNPDEIPKNKVATYISETELYNLTFDLLKIVREAIIYLTLSVTIKENEKVKASSIDKMITMKVHQVEDGFKI